MAEKKVRNLYLDFAKAIAIILVVAGHCIQFGSGIDYLARQLFYENDIFKFIYSFHMPLFMLISGYLFAFGIKKKTTDLIMNKLNGLIVPKLVWAIFPLILFIISRLIKGDASVVSTIMYYISYSLNSLWFLWAVFWNSLAVIVVNKYFKDNIYIYVLLFIISFIFPDNFNLYLYKFMYPYFVLGYLCNKYKLNDRYSKVYKNTYSLLVIGAIYFVMLSFFGNEIYIYVSGYTIIGKNLINQLGIDLFRFSIGLVGSVFILIALYKLYINQTFNRLLHKNNFIITIGQSTLGIYIISDFINLYPDFGNASPKILFEVK